MLDIFKLNISIFNISIQYYILYKYKYFINIKDIQKVFKSFNHMNFKVSKYDLYHFSKTTNIKDLLKNYEEQSISRIDDMIKEINK